jgi:hypothetical protein
MPRYVITANETFVAWYGVDAEDVQEALDLFYNGEGELIDRECVDYDYTHIARESV